MMQREVRKRLDVQVRRNGDIYASIGFKIIIVRGHWNQMLSVLMVSLFFFECSNQWDGKFPTITISDDIVIDEGSQRLFFVETKEITVFTISLVKN